MAKGNINDDICELDLYPRMCRNVYGSQTNIRSPQSQTISLSALVLFVGVLHLLDYFRRVFEKALA